MKEERPKSRLISQTVTEPGRGNKGIISSSYGCKTKERVLKLGQATWSQGQGFCFCPKFKNLGFVIFPKIFLLTILRFVKIWWDQEKILTF